MYNARNIKKQMSKHENEARKSMRKAGLAVIAAQRMSNLVGGLGNGDGGRRSRKAKERAPAPGAIDSSKLMIDYWRKQNAEVANRKTPEYKNGRKAQVVNAKDRLAVPAGRIVMLRHGDARSWQYGLCTREPHKSAPIARVRLLAVPVVSLPEDLHAVKNSAENTVADEIDIDGKELFDPDPGREYASRFDGETRRVLEKAVNHAVTHMADEEHTGERDRDDVLQKGELDLSHGKFLTACFQALDSDGDDLLTLDELKHWVKCIDEHADVSQETGMVDLLTTMGKDQTSAFRQGAHAWSELRVNWIDFQLLMLDFYIALGVGFMETRYRKLLLDPIFPVGNDGNSGSLLVGGEAAARREANSEQSRTEGKSAGDTVAAMATKSPAAAAVMAATDTAITATDLARKEEDDDDDERDGFSIADDTETITAEDIPSASTTATPPEPGQPEPPKEDQPARTSPEIAVPDPSSPIPRELLPGTPVE